MSHGHQRRDSYITAQEVYMFSGHRKPNGYPWSLGTARLM